MLPSTSTSHVATLQQKGATNQCNFNYIRLLLSSGRSPSRIFEITASNRCSARRSNATFFTQTIWMRSIISSATFWMMKLWGQSYSSILITLQCSAPVFVLRSPQRICALIHAPLMRIGQRVFDINKRLSCLPGGTLGGAATTIVTSISTILKPSHHWRLLVNPRWWNTKENSPWTKGTTSTINKLRRSFSQSRPNL